MTMAFKILMLNGSPHKNGNTALALAEMKTVFDHEGFETECLHIGNQAIRGCIACGACAKTGKAAGQFIEVMACEGGCITGPSTQNYIVSGRRQLVQELLKRKESYETMGR